MEIIPQHMRSDFRKLLLRIPSLEKQANEHKDLYQKHLNQSPSFYNWGFLSFSNSKVFTIIVDQINIYIAPSSSKSFNDFDKFSISEILNHQTEQGLLRFLGMRVPFFKTSFTFNDKTKFDFNIVRLNKKNLKLIEQLLITVLQKENRSVNEPKATRIDQKMDTEVNSVIIYDYDNLPLKTEADLTQDVQAMQIKEVLEPFYPIHRSLFASRRTISETEMKKLQDVTPNVKFILVPPEKDAADLQLIQDTLEYIKLFKPIKAIIISADRIFGKLIDNLIELDIDVYIVHKVKRLTRQLEDKLPLDHIIILEDEKFSCIFCEKTYTKGTSLKQHVDSKHTKCVTCEKPFGNKNSLDQHITATSH